MVYLKTVAVNMAPHRYAAETQLCHHARNRPEGVWPRRRLEYATQTLANMGKSEKVANRSDQEVPLNTGRR